MSEVIPAEDKPIAAYDEFRAQLAELKAHNDSLVFDYADPTGNKDARSHIHKLRKTKTAIDKARKEEKAKSLEYGRKVDGEAKEITVEIEAMIDVHAAPIKELEDQEKDRIADILARITSIRVIGADLPGAIDDLYATHAECKEIVVDETFAEYMAEASMTKKEAIVSIEAAITSAEARGELERLRREQAQREQDEREKRLVVEAEERIRSKAESEARDLERRLEAERSAEREASERAVKEAEDRAARAEQDRLNAERATQERLEAEALARYNKAAAEQRKRDESKKIREATRQKVVEAIRSGFEGMAGDTEALAQRVFDKIDAGEIPHVTIKY